jgi:predicted nucleic acid-binding protein
MVVFLDANVFLYAAGTDPLRSEPCRAILRSVQEGRVAACTSTEVVQEVLHVVSRRLGGAAAVVAAEAVLDLVPVPIAVTGAVMRRALVVLVSAPGVSVRDAVHAAAMAEVSCTTIVSADKHFDLIAGLRRIDPLDAQAVMAWLG